jgi:tetratricopeptide (TPR) repeat protein
MKRAWGTALLILCTAVLAAPSSWGGEAQRQKADALWSQREDLGKAREAVVAWEAVLAEQPGDYDALLRLSRLHYWIGQLLEKTDRERALSEYHAGKEYGHEAATAAPDKPGGHFFEAANLARENNLKGTFSNLWGIGIVRRLNEKTAAIDPSYFYQGPDRFFCAMYTKLPGLLGGSTSLAIEHGKKAVKAYPHYVGNRYFLAEAYFKSGKNDLARSQLEAAVATPDDALPDVVPEQRMEKARAAELLGRIGQGKR